MPVVVITADRCDERDAGLRENGIGKTNCAAISVEFDEYQAVKVLRTMS